MPLPDPLVDPRCVEVAEYFIQGWPHTEPRAVFVMELAARIQRAVEDWFADQESEEG